MASKHSLDQVRETFTAREVEMIHAIKHDYDMRLLDYEGEGLDEASWGHETGFLLSMNDAALLLRATLAALSSMEAEAGEVARLTEHFTYIFDDEEIVAMSEAAAGYRWMEDTKQFDLCAKAMKKVLMQWRDSFHPKAHGEVELTEAEVDGLKKDKQRLDFLDQANARLNAHYKTVYRWELIMNHNVNRLMLPGMAVDLNDARANGLPSCRDAIDAAISRLSIPSPPSTT